MHPFFVLIFLLNNCSCRRLGRGCSTSTTNPSSSYRSWVCPTIWLGLNYCFLMLWFCPVLQF